MKKGDKVRVIKDIDYPQNGEYYVSQNVNKGEIYTLDFDLSNKLNGRYWILKEQTMEGIIDKWAFEFQLELVESIKNNNLTNMNMQEKFVLAFKSEPEKTFRKTGITNGDDILTDDGMKIFLSWLLKKNQVEFKKEVADNLLEEQEKEEKK